MKKFGLIYKVINKINGKVYIGQTTQGLEKRMKQHLYCVKKGHSSLVLYRAIRKYGQENFSWDIIDYCDSGEELSLQEMYYIKKYKSVEKGYNLYFNVQCQAGKNHPRFGKKHSDETRRKMRRAWKNRPAISDETRKKMSEGQKRRDKTTIVLPKIKKGKEHPCFGKPWSNERKLKASIANSGCGNPFYGKKHTEKTKTIMSKNHADVSGNNNPMYGKIGSDCPNSKKYVVTTPRNYSFVVHGLHNFCLNYEEATLYSASLSMCVSGRRNHHKGYKCRCYNEELDVNLPVWGRCIE